MKPFTVIESTAYGGYNILPASEIVNQILRVSHQEAPMRLPQMLEHDYCWYSMDNKQVALEHVAAIVLAYQMQLPVQIKLNMEVLVNCVTRDMAERVYKLAVQRLGYKGSLTYTHYPRAHTSGFRVPIPNETWGNTRTDWVFERVEQFNKMMPLHALQGMTLLQEERIVPDAFWVADKVQTVIAAPRSLDPILCAQFGQWFAGIAMWL